MKRPGGRFGRYLYPIMEGDDAPPRDAIIGNMHTLGRDPRGTEHPGRFFRRDARWHYLWPFNPEERSFDIVADPLEQRDLHDLRPEAVRRLRRARRSTIRHLASLSVCLLFAILPGATGCGNTKRAPNVIIIVIDTLRADRLHSHGNPNTTTPHIDRLAAEGTRYTRAYSQAPWTTPSIGALFTSQYPSRLGIWRNVSRLPDEFDSIAEVLAREGYATGAVVSHSFCSRKWGFAQGFDSFDESNIKGLMATTSPDVTDRAIEWLDTRTAAGDGQPFFLFVHYFDPHFLYLEHEDHRFPSEGRKYEGVVRSPVTDSQLRALPPKPTEADLAEMLRIYDSELAFTDAHVGRLLDHLRETGIYDDAIIVLTGDHGEEFGDHGRFKHTKTLYEEVINVPLIIRRPGEAPRVDTMPVALVDVFPTILDHLDIPAPEQLRGTSLIERAPEELHIVYSETSRHSLLRGIVVGRYKLILDMANGSRELFDLEADPDERHNVADRYPGVRDALTEKLKEWIRSNPVRVPDTAPVEIDPEEEARLEALGYAE